MKKFLAVVALLFPIVANAYTGDAYILRGSLKGDTSEKTWSVQGGFNHALNSKFGIGAMYLNEGHLTNHHRDGFGFQAFYYKDIGSFQFQLGAGPYLSLDNTNVATGERLNEKHFGVISSAAVKWYPTNSYWHLRVQYNNVYMPNTFNTRSILVGLGSDFTRRTTEMSTAQWTVWVGRSRTNVTESTGATAAQVEMKQPINDHVSYSISGIMEGNTGVANRRGVAAQLWLDAHSSNWTYSAGAGPYLAYDPYNTTHVSAIASMRVQRNIGMGTAVGFNFNRVITSYHRDEDMFMFGISKRF